VAKCFANIHLKGEYTNNILPDWLIYDIYSYLKLIQNHIPDYRALELLSLRYFSISLTIYKNPNQKSTNHEIIIFLSCSYGNMSFIRRM
jgi:hypothetical protein